MMNFSEFININKDKNILIVTDDKDNITRLIRRENLNDKVISRVKIASLDELCKQLIVDSKLAKDALDFNDDLLINVVDTETVNYIIGTIINRIPNFFAPKECFCDELYAEIYQLVNQLRSGKVTDSFKNTKDEKAQQLKKIIDQFEAYLKNNNLYDYTRLIQTAIESKVQYSDLTGVVLFNEPTYLINELLNKCLTNKVILDYRYEGLVNYKFTKCYGHVNEINNIVNQINNQHLQLGDINILYPTAAFEPVLHGVLATNGIKYNFLSNVSACSDPVVQIIRLVAKWARGNYQYADLEKLFLTVPFSYLYQDFVNGIDSSICWGLDRYQERLLHKSISENLSFVLGKLIAIFENTDSVIDVSELLETLLNFAKEYTASYLTKAEGAINSIINRCRLLNLRDSLIGGLDYIINQMDKLAIADSESSDSVNCICFSNKVEVLERKHNFIIGLADRDFTKKTIESDILRDREIKEYIDGTFGRVVLASENEIVHQQNIINSLNTIINGNVNLSYSYNSPVENLELSPSVFYTNMLRTHSEAIEERIDSYPNLIVNDIRNDIPVIQPALPVIPTTNLSLSATRLDTLIHCPLEYRFSQFDELNEIQYQGRDKSTWLQANERGTIVHNTFDKYIKEEFIDKTVSANLNEAKLDKYFDSAIKDILVDHPCLSDTVYQAEKKEMYVGIKSYLMDMHKQFSENRKLKVLYTELDLRKEKDCKITSPNGLVFQISGQIDRVDYDGDNYYIVDYKSGKYSSKEKEVKAKQLSGRTLQHVLYSIGLSKKLKTDVHNFYYHFPFESNQNRELAVEIDDCDTFEDEVWQRIEDVYLNHNFKVDKCNNRYCKFKKVCKFAFSSKEEEDD